MVDHDLVTAKLAVIDRCLARIAEVRGESGKGFRPVDIEDITAINLVRAIQAAIDLATHVVATESYGTPDSTATAFTLLEQQGVIDPDLAGRLRRMVGFRNIAVHDYQALDSAVVERIVEQHLGDLRSLGMQISKTFSL